MQHPKTLVTAAASLAGLAVASVLGTASAFDHPADTVRITVDRDVIDNYRRYGKRRRGGKRQARTYKGSSAAKRAARQAQMRAKAAARPARRRKRQWAEAHGLARTWYARWESGMPVNFSFTEAREHRPGGVYPRAMALLVKRLGPSYTWSAEHNRGVVQLQGPPSPIRPLPMMHRHRSA